MSRLIDADALVFSRVRIAHEDGTIGGYNAVVMSSEIKHAPTVEAIPIDWIMNYAFSGKHGRPISVTLMLSEWRREHEAD